MSLLDKVTKKQVAFDPTNKEHLQAFESVYLHGRQHPTLRFTLDEGYTSVVTMAQDKILKTLVFGRK